METLLRNAYTPWIKYLSYFKQISQLLEQKNYSKEKSTSKNIFFFETAFWKVCK